MLATVAAIMSSTWHPRMPCCVQYLVGLAHLSGSSFRLSFTSERKARASNRPSELSAAGSASFVSIGFVSRLQLFCSRIQVVGEAWRHSATCSYTVAQTDTGATSDTSASRTSRQPNDATELGVVYSTRLTATKLTQCDEPVGPS